MIPFSKKRQHGFIGVSQSFSGFSFSNLKKLNEHSSKISTVFCSTIAGPKPVVPAVKNNLDREENSNRYPENTFSILPKFSVQSQNMHKEKYFSSPQRGEETKKNKVSSIENYLLFKINYLKKSFPQGGPTKWNLFLTRKSVGFSNFSFSRFSPLLEKRNFPSLTLLDNQIMPTVSLQIKRWSETEKKKRVFPLSTVKKKFFKKNSHRFLSLSMEKKKQNYSYTNLTYSSEFYIPVQITDQISKKMYLRWFLLADLPIQTKRGHFIINGYPKTVIHQITRSPGIRFKNQNHQILADIISVRGAWMGIQISYEKISRFSLETRETVKTGLKGAKEIIDLAKEQEKEKAKRLKRERKAAEEERLQREYEKEFGTEDAEEYIPEEEKQKDQNNQKEDHQENDKDQENDDEIDKEEIEEEYNEEDNQEDYQDQEDDNEFDEEIDEEYNEEDDNEFEEEIDEEYNEEDDQEKDQEKDHQKENQKEEKQENEEYKDQNQKNEEDEDKEEQEREIKEEKHQSEEAKKKMKKTMVFFLEKAPLFFPINLFSFTSNRTSEEFFKVFKHDQKFITMSSWFLMKKQKKELKTSLFPYLYGYKPFHTEERHAGKNYKNMGIRNLISGFAKKATWSNSPTCYTAGNALFFVKKEEYHHGVKNLLNSACQLPLYSIRSQNLWNLTKPKTFLVLKNPAICHWWEKTVPFLRPNLGQKTQNFESFQQRVSDKKDIVFPGPNLIEGNKKEEKKIFKIPTWSSSYSKSSLNETIHETLFILFFSSSPFSKNHEQYQEKKKKLKVSGFAFLSYLFDHPYFIYNNYTQLFEPVTQVSLNGSAPKKKKTLGKIIKVVKKQRFQPYRLYKTIPISSNRSKEKLISVLNTTNFRNILFERFLNPKYYDIGLMGRKRLNKKLRLNIPLQCTTLTSLDFLAIFYKLFSFHLILNSEFPLDQIGLSSLPTSEEKNTKNLKGSLALNYLANKVLNTGSSSKEDNLFKKQSLEHNALDHLNQRHIRTSGEFIFLQFWRATLRFYQLLSRLSTRNSFLRSPKIERNFYSFPLELMVLNSYNSRQPPLNQNDTIIEPANKSRLSQKEKEYFYNLEEQQEIESQKPKKKKKTLYNLKWKMPNFSENNLAVKNMSKSKWQPISQFSHLFNSFKEFSFPQLKHPKKEFQPSFLKIILQNNTLPEPPLPSIGKNDLNRYMALSKITEKKNTHILSIIPSIKDTKMNTLANFRHYVKVPPINGNDLYTILPFFPSSDSFFSTNPIGGKIGITAKIFKMNKTISKVFLNRVKSKASKLQGYTLRFSIKKLITTPSNKFFTAATTSLNMIPLKGVSRKSSSVSLSSWSKIQSTGFPWLKRPSNIKDMWEKVKSFRRKKKKKKFSLKFSDFDTSSWLSRSISRRVKFFSKFSFSNRLVYNLKTFSYKTLFSRSIKQPQRKIPRGVQASLSLWSKKRNNPKWNNNQKQSKDSVLWQKSNLGIFNSSEISLSKRQSTNLKKPNQPDRKTLAWLYPTLIKSVSYLSGRQEKYPKKLFKKVENLNRIEKKTLSKKKSVLQKSFRFGDRVFPLASKWKHTGLIGDRKLKKPTSIINKQLNQPSLLGFFEMLVDSFSDWTPFNPNERLDKENLETKLFNGIFKEFFNLDPLSQQLDETNGLAEIIQKRRISALGKGGVTSRNAPLSIRSIHPSFYGRLCPIDSPEGDRVGLMNSLTNYAKVTSIGYIATPFYRTRLTSMFSEDHSSLVSNPREDSLSINKKSILPSPSLLVFPNQEEVRVIKMKICPPSVFFGKSYNSDDTFFNHMSSSFLMKFKSRGEKHAGKLPKKQSFYFLHSNTSIFTFPIVSERDRSERFWPRKSFFTTGFISKLPIGLSPMIPQGGFFTATSFPGNTGNLGQAILKKEFFGEVKSKNRFTRKIGPSVTEKEKTFRNDLPKFYDTHYMTPPITYRQVLPANQSKKTFWDKLKTSTYRLNLKKPNRRDSQIPVSKFNTTGENNFFIKPWLPISAPSLSLKETENNKKVIKSLTTIIIDSVRSSKFLTCYFDFISLEGYAPLNSFQFFSPGVGLIPFLEHDDGTRALMGANMQRQAVPLINAERPIVGTGLEKNIAASFIISSNYSSYLYYISGKQSKQIYSGPSINFSMSNDIASSIKLGSVEGKTSKFPTKAKNRPKFLEAKGLEAMIGKQIDLCFPTKKLGLTVNNEQKKADSYKNMKSMIGCIESFPRFSYRREVSAESYLSDNQWWSETKLGKPEVNKFNSTKQYSSFNKKMPKASAFQSQNRIYKTLSKEKQRRENFILNLHWLPYRKSYKAICINKKPTSLENSWLQKGDLLIDGSSSINGELSLGYNLFSIYMPWEGYNFEDAILISDRAVQAYTSIHIEELSVKISKNELISSIIKPKTWITQGEVLVSKKRPVENEYLMNRLIFGIFSISSKQKKTNLQSKPNQNSQESSPLSKFTNSSKSEDFEVDTSLRTSESTFGWIISVKQLNPFISHSKISNTFSSTIKKGYLSSRSLTREHGGSFLSPSYIFMLPLWKNRILRAASSFFLGQALPVVSLKAKQSARTYKKKKNPGGVKSYSMLWNLKNPNRHSRKTPTPLYLITDQQKTYSQEVDKFNRMKKIFNKSHASISFFFKKKRSIPRASKSLKKKKSFFQQYFANTMKKKTYLNFSDQKKTNKKNKKQFFFRKTILSLNSTILSNTPWFYRNNIISLLGSRTVPPGTNSSFFSESFFQMFAKGYSQKIKTATHQKGPKNSRKSLSKENKNLNSKSFQKSNQPSSKLNKSLGGRKNKAKKKNEKFSQQFLNEETPIEKLIYIAIAKQLQIGDKMSGRHGNKGIISKILPFYDMPYLIDGTPIDIVLNPLGVPSRMNVGQLYESLLGFSGFYRHQYYRIPPFDENYGYQFSRNFIYNKLHELNQQHYNSFFSTVCPSSLSEKNTVFLQSNDPWYSISTALSPYGTPETSKIQGGQIEYHQRKTMLFQSLYKKSKNFDNFLSAPSFLSWSELFVPRLQKKKNSFASNRKKIDFTRSYAYPYWNKKIELTRLRIGLNPSFPGKMRLIDGRTGETFYRPVIVGKSYMLKLNHLVDHKIHARTTGPYALITQQPLKGKRNQGGQRVGEMEVWSFYAFGSASLLFEMLTSKSDDIIGRKRILGDIAGLPKDPLDTNLAESFRVLIMNLRALCLDLSVFKDFKSLDYYIFKDPKSYFDNHPSDQLKSIKKLKGGLASENKKDFDKDMKTKATKKKKKEN